MSQKPVGTAVAKLEAVPEIATVNGADSPEVTVCCNKSVLLGQTLFFVRFAEISKALAVGKIVNIAIAVIAVNKKTPNARLFFILFCYHFGRDRLYINFMMV